MSEPEHPFYNGTREVDFQPLIVKTFEPALEISYFQSITAMPQYFFFSFEEVRLTDYSQAHPLLPAPFFRSVETIPPPTYEKVQSRIYNVLELRRANSNRYPGLANSNYTCWDAVLKTFGGNKSCRKLHSHSPILKWPPVQNQQVSHEESKNQARKHVDKKQPASGALGKGGLAGSRFA